MLTIAKRKTRFNSASGRDETTDCFQGTPRFNPPESEDPNRQARHSDMSGHLALDMTFHAAVRMQQRRISAAHIDVAIRYGRVFHTRDAEIYVIGLREIRKYRKDPRMTAALNGLHVVCGRSGRIITCYRNMHFKRNSFDWSRRRREAHALDYRRQPEIVTEYSPVQPQATE